MSRQHAPAALEDILAGSFPELQPEAITKLVDYYEVVLKWNKRISLTTVTEPKPFAQRHLGEAIFAANLLQGSITEFWDIGSGLGIPGIPVAIVRPDLDVRLVESNRKKAIFLEEATEGLRLDRVKVINARFETLSEFSENSCISTRAVERMSEVVRLVLERGQTAGQLLIFGGADLPLSATGKRLTAHLLAGSTERFLYEIR